MRIYPARLSSVTAYAGESSSHNLYEVHLTIQEYGELKASGDDSAILLLGHGVEVRGTRDPALTTTTPDGATVTYRS